MMGTFNTALTSGPPAREPEYDGANSPIRKTREPVQLLDGHAVDRAGGRHPIAPCGHWAPTGECRHGC